MKSESPPLSRDWITALSLAALWFAIVLAFSGGCAGYSKNVATTALASVRATRAVVDALDTADMFVQPSCPDSACLVTWRKKRDAAADACQVLLDTLGKFTEAAQ
jgi:hypothetical protein